MKKLFEVKTGQFLELGKDWLDGVDYIIICNGVMNLVCNHIIQNIYPNTYITYEMKDLI